MISLGLNRVSDGGLKVLCLGAHSDDIEIGALGTILGLNEKHDRATITWVVFGADESRALEARASAEACTRGYKSANIAVHEFRDGLFPSQLESIKAEFESLKQRYNPDVIFTHHREDLHQDHRVISDLTWQTFRDHMIFEFEIPKYDGDLGRPNVYCSLSQQDHDEKIAILEKYFESQKERSWFKPETFTSLMRLRGVECNSVSGFAEAFYCRKAIFSG